MTTVSDEVMLVDYKPEFRSAFRDLNVEWISRYFKMEAADYEALDNPEATIIGAGGFITVALLNGAPVGVCALYPHGTEWELAKMAVSPSAQGKGIGRLLGIRIIEKARELGAVSIFLESNTRLTPAITLYRKLGFVEVPRRPSPYERSNIRMELQLGKEA